MRRRESRSSCTRGASRTTGGCSRRNDVSAGLPVLWQYSFSNYNEKARWALDFKGIRHRRHSVMPGWFRGPLAIPRRPDAARCSTSTARRLMDSTRIIAALEARHPEPALYPADSEERRRALELEDFFDEHAGHDMRRVGFWELRENLDYALDFMTTDQPRIKRGWRGCGLRLDFPSSGAT